MLLLPIVRGQWFKTVNIYFASFDSLLIAVDWIRTCVSLVPEVTTLPEKTLILCFVFGCRCFACVELETHQIVW